MRKVTIAIIVVIGVLACSAFIGKGEYEKAIEQFLSDIINGEVDKAYNELLSGTMLANRSEAVDQQKQQTSRLFDSYGKLLGFEPVKKQTFGKSLVRLVYVMKCEKMPLVWEFYYYKADKDWQLISLKSRDTFDMLADK
ncbi:MAG: hypothetical protein ACYSSP_01145 [Planctomycetota bacterium]|jgi:hypothetical protein